MASHAQGQGVSRRGALKAGVAGLAALLTLGNITPALAEELAHLAGGRPMSGARLVSILRTERARWNALLAQVSPARLEITGVEEAWSVKDLVAHLTWYEQAVVEGARQVLGGDKFTRPRPEGVSLDEQNARILAASRARTAHDVLAEADAVFNDLVTILAACPQGILNDPHLLGLPDDMVPWIGVANNSYAHYRQHEPALRAWIARAG